MPWKVYHENGKYCLHKHVGGKKGDLVSGGCHDTPEEARKHQAALYVNEKKELNPDELLKELEHFDPIIEDEEKEISRPDLPAGIATSFAELDAQREYTERMRDLDFLMGDFQSLVGNIIYTPESLLEEDKVKALSDLFDEFKGLVDQTLNEPIDDENKEADEELKEVWTAAYVNDLPDSSFLYIEPGGKKDGQGKTVPRSYRHLPVKDANGKPDSAHVKNAAARANQVKTHGGGTISPALAKRLISKARSMLTKVKKEDESFIDKVKEVVKSIFAKEEDTKSLMVWKEADGSYSWLSTYSNKFLDNDYPPDILSSDSHKKFVEKIDKGDAPLPELWIWHVPEWKVGYATSVAYDDVGFPVSIGKFDDDCKEIAEWMSTQEDFGVSHGMWKHSIKRDPNDESVIVEYETYEISPLPRSRAANKLADFVILSKEQKEEDMTIPTEKREELLKRGLPENLLSALEERNKATADKANADGIKSKEETTATETPPVPDSTVVPPVEPKTEVPPTPPADTSQYPTREEVAEAIATVVAPMINELKEQFASLQTQMKEMDSKSEQRIKELITSTPRDSLASIMAERLVPHASKSTETVLQRGDNLLNLKPKETKAQKPGIGIPFIDKMTNPEPKE